MTSVDCMPGQHRQSRPFTFRTNGHQRKKCRPRARFVFGAVCVIGLFASTNANCQDPEPTFGGSKKVSSFYSDGGERKPGAAPTLAPEVCRPIGMVRIDEHAVGNLAWVIDRDNSCVGGAGDSNVELTGYLARALISPAVAPVVAVRQFQEGRLSGGQLAECQLTACQLVTSDATEYPAQSIEPAPATPATCDLCRACQTRSRCRIDWQDDVRSFWPDVWDDAKSISNLQNGLVLGVGLATAIGLRQGVDQDIRKSSARHPERWGNTSNILGRFGDVQYQLPILGAIYGYSLLQQDAELHQLSNSMLSAYTITGLSTVAIKGIANTDRPTNDWNGGMFGFPSFHTSSSFALAAVADEYYGTGVGIPAYLAAGLIGWSRIDERDHDLSDVVFGAALGFVIGKAVAGRHLRGDTRVKILPFVDPNDGGCGVLFDFEF